MQNFKIETDADGVALVVFDVPGRTMNTLTLEVIDELGQVVEAIRSDAAIEGAVITSGKTTGFCAGADLVDIGSGLSAAIGVAVARNSGKVLLIDGDGSLYQHIQELETIQRQGISLP